MRSFQVGAHKPSSLIAHSYRVSPFSVITKKEERPAEKARSQPQIRAIKHPSSHRCAELCALAAEPALLC